MLGGTAVVAGVCDLVSHLPLSPVLSWVYADGLVGLLSWAQQQPGQDVILSYSSCLACLCLCCVRR